MAIRENNRHNKYFGKLPHTLENLENRHAHISTYNHKQFEKTSFFTSGLCLGSVQIGNKAKTRDPNIGHRDNIQNISYSFVLFLLSLVIYENL
jgi:hypothetical protein